MHDYVRRQVHVRDPNAEEYRQLDRALDEAEREADEYRGELRRKYLPGNVRYDGGPLSGQTDTFHEMPDTIGANERVGDEVRAARGAYLITDDADEQGRRIFRWMPVSGGET